MLNRANRETAPCPRSGRGEAACAEEPLQEAVWQLRGQVVGEHSSIFKARGTQHAALVDRGRGPCKPPRGATHGGNRNGGVISGCLPPSNALLHESRYRCFDMGITAGNSLHGQTENCSHPTPLRAEWQMLVAVNLSARGGASPPLPHYLAVLYTRGRVAPRSANNPLLSTCNSRARSITASAHS